MAHLKIQKYFIRAAYILIDICIISFCIYLAAVLRASTLPFSVTFHNLFFSQVNPFRFVFLFWIVTIIIFLVSKSLYRTRREVMESFEVGQVIKYVVLSSILVILAIYSFKIEGFPRSVLFIGTMFIMFFLSLWRILKRNFVEYLVSRGYNNFNVLIIGAGRVGVALANEIRKNRGLGLKIAGFLDDHKQNVPGMRLEVLGKIDQFRNIVKREFIDEVFVTFHENNEAFINLLEQSRELNVAFRVVPQGFELMHGDFSKYNIGIIPILEYTRAFPLKIQLGKRLFDIVMSLIGIIFLMPVFLIIGLIVKIHNPGPVFYVSKRYGKNGRIFHMLKFRSMYRDADRRMEEYAHKNEVDGPIFKIKDDPRITKLGKFLRKYSLDELPQIFNVLKGDMSLVGPRPLPIDQIEKEDLRQLKRLEVRPGITGLWQIRGRSDVSFQRLVKWDVWYINNWSFWLDLNIIYRTIPVVLKARGAY